MRGSYTESQESCPKLLFRCDELPSSTTLKLKELVLTRLEQNQKWNPFPKSLTYRIISICTLSITAIAGGYSSDSRGCFRPIAGNNFRERRRKRRRRIGEKKKKRIIREKEESNRGGGRGCTGDSFAAGGETSVRGDATGECGCGRD